MALLGDRGAGLLRADRTGRWFRVVPAVGVLVGSLVLTGCEPPDSDGKEHSGNRSSRSDTSFNGGTGRGLILYRSSVSSTDGGSSRQRITVRNSKGRKVAGGRVKDGMHSYRLAPGIYTVRITGGGSSCTSTVRVRSSRTSRISVSC
jgi:hypothetical protein